MADAGGYRYLPPALADGLARLGIAVRRPVHGRQRGLHRSPHFGASVEFAEYREYAPGDPVERIDWAAFARSDRYVVRKYHEETNLCATILLDTSSSLDYRERGPMTKLEYACTLVAALLYTLVNQGDSVALFGFDARVHSAFDPVGGREGIRPLLRHLETVRPSGRGDIEAALHDAVERMRSRGLLIVVSDFLQAAPAILRGVQHAHHNGHSLLALQVLDPAERTLEGDGVLDLRELETGEHLVVDPGELRDAYAEAVERHLAALRTGCAECLADHHVFHTSEPILDAMHRIGRRAGG